MDDSDWYWEDDPPETRKERRKRKKREKRSAVIQEVIDVLRDPENKVIGTCHGCTNVLNDAANFLVRHYEVGGQKNSEASMDHATLTAIKISGAVNPGANAVSTVGDDGLPVIRIIVYVSEDGRTVHVLDS